MKKKIAQTGVRFYEEDREVWERFNAVVEAQENKHVNKTFLRLLKAGLDATDGNSSNAAFSATPEGQTELLVMIRQVVTAAVSDGLAGIAFAKRTTEHPVKETAEITAMLDMLAADLEGE